MVKKYNVQNRGRKVWLLFVAGLLLSVFSFCFLLPTSLLFRSEWASVDSFWNGILGTWSGWVIGLSLVVLVVSLLLYSVLHRWKRGWQAQVLAVSAVLISLLGTMGVSGVFTPASSSERIKTLFVLSGNEDWEGIIDYCQKHPCSTYLEENILNMAYAETGQLSDVFSKRRNRNVQSLFVLNVETPYVSALLSDVYWSMGEISMSQMYAFEANEKMDNASPRLLKRLVKTNIVFGYYNVAEKYLNLLSQNPFHAAFVAHYRALLDDASVAADPELGMKRRCIPLENGFPSSRSLPYDLQQILQQAPEHQTSAQYLSAIQML